MNKELEAFKRIWTMFDFKDMQYERSLIIKALTPPTSDEVIKELWKVFTLADEIYYSDDLKQFYSKKGKLVYAISDYSNSYVGIEDVLPPHLIEMIGKFYKSLEKGE